jgi:iron complex outermembrane receptor protein
MAGSIRTSIAPMAAAISAVFAFSAPQAFAAESSSALEEVIVTAQRKQTLLQDTPIAVTAFNQQQIQDMGIFDITDIGNLAPNTSIQKQPSSNSNTAIFIRGVGSGETALLADPKISFYIDGVYMSKTVGAVFDIVDMESVEVLRGPQGTLFGRNSTGGALNVTTVKPSGELAVDLEGSVGNDGLQRLKASVDLPQMFDMLSVKLSAMTMEYDGWAENHYGGQSEKDLASEDNDTYRIALRFEPIDNLTIDYAYDKTDNEGVPTPFQITEVKSELYNGFSITPFPFEYLGGELYQEMAKTVGDPNDRHDDFNLEAVSTEKLEVDGHTLTVEWELEAFTMKYIFADRDTDSTYKSTDLDAGAYIARDAFYGGGAAVPTPGFHAAIPKGYIEMTTHEFQIFGDLFDEKLSYTLGYYNYHEEVYQDNPQTFALPLAFIVPRSEALKPIYEALGFCDTGVCIGTQRLPFPFPQPGADPNLNGFQDFIYGQDSDSWAIYGQATYSLRDDLELTAGIRYTEDEKDAFLFNEGLNHESIDDAFKNDDDWSKTTYMANLNYFLNEDINLYGSVSTGYNSGGFNARAASVPGWENQVDEEEITSYELGMKAEWLDNRLRTNVAVFYNDFDDIQISQFEAGSGGASTRLLNAGEATYWGVELDAVAILAEGLVLDLTYGYLDAEFDEYIARNPVTDLEEDISDVTTVSRAPESTMHIGLQYDFSPFTWSSMSARVDANYTDEFVFSSIQNQYDAADDRWLLNARLSMNDISIGERGTLRISAWGKNLADEEYREWGIDFGSLGYAGNVMGRPRTYGIDVVYNFN